jgi:AraC-like DNA-binding protein
MPAFTYEIHNMNDPLLPFRFRPFMEVRRRQSLPNWHEETEILYTFEGEGLVRLGGEEVPFGKGDAVVVNTRTPHFVESDGVVRYCCLIVKNAFLTDNGIDPALLRFDPRVRTAELQAALELVRGAFAEYSEKRFDGVLQIRSAVLSLFCLLCQKHAAPLKDAAKTDESVNLALTYLHGHFRENLTLDQIAAFVGASKFHLSREFKRSTGRTIMNTVMLLRLYEAKELIEKGSRISSAARSCGFSNLSYFTRCFQKHFQILPSQIGKKEQKSKI